MINFRGGRRADTYTLAGGQWEGRKVVTQRWGGQKEGRKRPSSSDSPVGVKEE